MSNKNESMFKYKNKKGITLVAIIIFIVIVLILTGSAVYLGSKNSSMSSASTVKLEADKTNMIQGYKSNYDDLLYKYGGDD